MLNPERNKALILGTGGAAKAVRQGLINLGVEPVMVSRTPNEGVITYADITPEVMDAHKIIVNTTPLGMYPHVDECPDIPYGLLTSSHLCYDLLYNPDVTLFMKKSSDMGAETKTALRCYCSRRLCRAANLGGSVGVVPHIFCVAFRACPYFTG